MRFCKQKAEIDGFGQLKIGQLNLARYVMQLRLDLEGLKIWTLVT